MTIQQFILNIDSEYQKNNNNMRRGQYIINSFFREFKPNFRIPQNVNCYYDDRNIKAFLLWIRLKKDNF
jgi:hypothetical protein